VAIRSFPLAAHRPTGVEVRDAAGTVASFGFVGGCVAYALGAAWAFFAKVEVDLLKLATQSGFVVGVGVIAWYFFDWTGLGH
jgi:hypothetical protein